MADVTDAWKTSNIAQNHGRLYRTVAVPGAGARPTMGSAVGVLDSGVAVHMGATKDGARLMVKSELEKFYVDEFRGPIVTNVNTVNMGISAELVGVTDMQLSAYLMPGVGTRSTSAGYDYITIGTKAIAYDCVVLTFALIEDTTKTGWFMLYNALNDSGVEWAQSRKALGGIPVSFVGYELTSRATADTLGQIGKVIA